VTARASASAETRHLRASAARRTAATRKKRCVSRCCLVLALCGWGFAIGNAQAQEPLDAAPPPEPPATYAKAPDGQVTIRAIRLTAPLKVDGILEESVYRENVPATDFIQQEPSEGAPASERTEAWVLFDGMNLYVAAYCHDTHPERMVVTEMRRDSQNIRQNDSFTVVIDTFHDRRSGVFFQTNPLGALREQEVTSERENNNDWNTIWNVGARRTPDGWTMEMVIPFRSLRYKSAGSQVWGINLRRTIRSKNEHVYISPIPASTGMQGIYRFAEAATLVGLETPAQGRNLELKPYAISSLTTNRAAARPFNDRVNGDMGFDAKYGLTKGLTLDFTYDTDFAQVEDDEQQVNLTRFSLFFPEKREFFLEGQGIFAFGGGQQAGAGGAGGGPAGGGSSRTQSANLTPVMFFSRRIGLQNNQVVPIRAGGRVTGRAGKFAIGVLNIQTGEHDEVNAAPTNFSVVRMRRDVFRKSTIGFIATRRNPGLAAGSNETYGADANLGFFQNLFVRAYYARSETAGIPSRDDDSYRGEIEYAGDRYGLQVEHLTVGRNFNPEIGFLRREDFRRNAAVLRFSPRPRTHFKAVRKFSYEASFDYITNPTGELESRELQGSFKTELQNSDVATLEYTRIFEWIPTSFAIARDVRILPGSYHFQDVKAQYQLGTQRPISGTVTLARGSFWGGTKTEAGYRGRVEFSSRFYAEPGVTFNVVNLPVGEFTTKLVSTRATFTLTPRMFTSALVQYNSSSNSLSGNYRFRWEYRPGSDLFVVYSDGRDTSVRGYPDLVNRTFVVKATRLFRF
jgi:hypothetical protein